MVSIQSGSTKKRGTQTQAMVKKWLAERQEMLVLYCKLAGIESFDPDKPEKQLLKDFCQLLVDYIAFGHFEIYDRITAGNERRAEVITIAKEAYPEIAKVTELVVAFNDKYDLNDHSQPLDNLNQDLSRLGEQLASRIELEDQLVQALMR